MSSDAKAAEHDMPTGPQDMQSENGDMPTGPSDVSSSKPGVDVAAIRAEVVRDVTAQVKAEVLRDIRAGRGPTIHVPSKPAVDESLVVQAAVCMAGGLQAVEKHFSEPVLEAAHKRRGIGLQDVLLLAAMSNGYDAGRKVHDGNIRQTLRAAFATHDIADLLAATYGKFMLGSFNAVESVWPEISVVRPVSDFKTATGLRLDGGFVYDEVGNDGKIKSADAGDDKRTISAKTYARMSSITRQDIINDDLGALTQVPQRLGRGAALKLNSVFWSEFESSNDTAYEKKTAAAGNALSLTSLKAAVGDYRKLKDPDGNPLGYTPAIILCPPELEVTAAELMGSSLIHGTSGAAPSTNVLAGRYRVVSSAYLSSATTWWLVANPSDLPTMEVAFLNGQRQPTVEQAEADFDVLGIQVRGYFDFGVSKGDKRAAYRMATA
jgi:phage major head subunit gpT-like protein